MKRLLIPVFISILGVLPLAGLDLSGEKTISSNAYYIPPRIANITPVSFFSSWDAPIQSNQTTHYQLRVNGFLFGTSTRNTSMSVKEIVPGSSFWVDYVIYHEGKILGISSQTPVLMCPGEPTGLYADEITTSSFRLTWMPVKSSAEYKIFVNGSLVQTVPSSTTKTTITGQAPGKKVTVTMIARNSTGDSFLSKPLDVLLRPPPPALTVVPGEISQTWFMVYWNQVESAATYTVFKNNLEYKSVGTQTSSMKVEECIPGATTTVKMRAQNATGYSEFSAEIAVLTIPATPSLPIAYDIGTTSFSLGWAPVTGAEGYKIWRDKEWLLARVPAPGLSTFLNKGFTPGETASMTVSCYNITGESPQSQALSVTLASASSAAIEISPLLSENPPKAPTIGMSLPDISLSNEQGKMTSIAALAENSPLILIIGNEKSLTRTVLKHLEKISRNPDLRDVCFTGIRISKSTEKPSKRQARKNFAIRANFGHVAIPGRQEPQKGAKDAEIKEKDRDISDKSKIPWLSATEIVANQTFPGISHLPIVLIFDSKRSLRGIEHDLAPNYLSKKIISLIVDEISTTSDYGKTLREEKSRFEKLYDPQTSNTMKNPENSK